MLVTIVVVLVSSWMGASWLLYSKAYYIIGHKYLVLGELPRNSPRMTATARDLEFPVHIPV